MAKAKKADAQRWAVCVQCGEYGLTRADQWVPGIDRPRCGFCGYGLNLTNEVPGPDPLLEPVGTVPGGKRYVRRARA